MLRRARGGGSSRSAASHLRQPPGATVAIACGNVSVRARTWNRSARPRENHRVSVFALKGFALRGHLRPPATEPPWRPVVGRRRLAGPRVGRATLERQAPSLRAERRAGSESWPMFPAPAHLAIDCRDRVYVVAPGTPVARCACSMPTADPLADPPSTVAAGARRLSAPAVRGGRARAVCALEPLLRSARQSANAQSAHRSRVRRRRQPGRTARSGAALYRTQPRPIGAGPLDSQHRPVRVAPRGAVRFAAAGHAASPCAPSAPTSAWTIAELDALAAVCAECAVADAFDGDGQWDCLVRAEPGRYLWLELALEGNGTATPAIGAIVVEFPRISLRRFLPAVFGMDPVERGLHRSFPRALRYAAAQHRAAGRSDGALFDPASAPATTGDPRQIDFLSWLGTLDRHRGRSQLGHRHAAAFPQAGRRAVRPPGHGRRPARAAAPAARLRSTSRPCAPETRALRPLRAARRSTAAPQPEAPPSESPPLVLEHFRLRRWLRVGAGRLGDDAVLWGERIVGARGSARTRRPGVTRLDASPDPGAAIRSSCTRINSRCSCRRAVEVGSRRARRSRTWCGPRRRPAPAAICTSSSRDSASASSRCSGSTRWSAALPQGVTLGETPLGGGLDSDRAAPSTVRRSRSAKKAVSAQRRASGERRFRYGPSSSRRFRLRTVPARRASSDRSPETPTGPAS